MKETTTEEILTLQEAQAQWLENYGNEDYYNYIKDDFSYIIINWKFDCKIPIIGYTLLSDGDDDLCSIYAVKEISSNKKEIVLSDGEVCAMDNSTWKLLSKEEAKKVATMENGKVSWKHNNIFANY